MQISEIEIDKIRPDPDQPRKRFDDEAIKGLAKNISIEGIINPIEVDKDYVIVTGETRWRAAKLAGLATVPIKVIDVPDSKLRFRRQFLENIHNNTMDIEETANAMAKYIKLFHKKRIYNDKGYEWLASEIGKNKEYVREHMGYLELNRKEKDIIKKGPKKFANSIRFLEGEAREGFLKKIKNREFTREVGSLVASALKAYPEYVSKILETNFKGMNVIEVKTFLNLNVKNYTSTPISDILKSKIELVEDIANQIMKLNGLLKIHSVSEMPNSQRARIMSLLYLLHTTIEEFSKEKVLITD
jgi:ParB/RepB/Spo0J family partition protein